MALWFFADGPYYFYLPKMILDFSSVNFYLSLVKRYFISSCKKYPLGSFDNGFGMENGDKTIVNFCENKKIF